MGHSCRTLLWDTLVRHSCWITVLGTLARHSCHGTLLRDTLLGHYRETLLWDALVENSGATLLWDTLAGHSLLWKALVGFSRATLWPCMPQTGSNNVTPNFVDTVNHTAPQRHAEVTPEPFPSPMAHANVLSTEAAQNRMAQRQRTRNFATRIHTVLIGTRYNHVTPSLVRGHHQSSCSPHAEFTTSSF